MCPICASSAQFEALRKNTFTGCHIFNMFSQLFHQTPASGGGYWQTPINSWIIPAFPSHLLNFITRLQGVCYAVALISGVRKISTCSCWKSGLYWHLSELVERLHHHRGTDTVPFSRSPVSGDKLFFSTSKCTCCLQALQCPAAASPGRESVAIDTGDNRVREWSDRLSSCLKVSVLLS